MNCGHPKTFFKVITETVSYPSDVPRTVRFKNSNGCALCVEIQAERAAVLEEAAKLFTHFYCADIIKWAQNTPTDNTSEIHLSTVLRDRILALKTPDRSTALSRMLDEARREVAWKITDARIDEHTAHCVDCKTEDNKFVACYRLTVLRKQLKQERAMPAASEGKPEGEQSKPPKENSDARQ